MLVRVTVLLVVAVVAGVVSFTLAMRRPPGAAPGAQLAVRASSTPSLTSTPAPTARAIGTSSPASSATPTPVRSSTPSASATITAQPSPTRAPPATPVATPVPAPGGGSAAGAATPAPTAGATPAGDPGGMGGTTRPATPVPSTPSAAGGVLSAEVELFSATARALAVRQAPVDAASVALESAQAGALLASGRARMTGDALQVYIQVSGDAAGAVAPLSAAGVQVERIDIAGQLVQGTVPLGRLDGLRGVAVVVRVRLPEYGTG